MLPENKEVLIKESDEGCTSKCRNFLGDPVVKTLPSNAGGVGSIPGWGAKIPHALWLKKPEHKQWKSCNKFSKDFFLIM